jgi:hypothetical protein
MRKHPPARAGVIPCALALLVCAIGRADNIVAPADFSTSVSFGGWYYGCQFEYGCGSDESFGPIASTSLQSDIDGSTTGYLTATIPVDGASFAYSEIDDQTGQPLDFFAFNNGSATAPTVFTFSNASQTGPQDISEFATTLYNFFNPFTATVSAYDSQGNLLGSTTANATLDPGDTCAFYFSCYSVFVGVDDLSSPVADIASVVVSTTQTDPTQNNWFAFGTIGVDETPEPSTFVLAGLAAACMLFSRKEQDIRERSGQNPRAPRCRIKRNERHAAHVADIDDRQSDECLSASGISVFAGAGHTGPE